MNATMTGKMNVVGSQVFVSVPSLTQEELKQTLIDLSKKGAIITTIVSRTEPDMRKTGNPYVGNVYKVSRVNGIINFNYEKAVNRQRGREGNDTDFEASPRKWGTRIHGTPLVEHKENTYVEMKVERCLETEYQLKDGTTISKDDFKEWLPSRKSSSSSQDVEKEIIVRDFNLINIVSITLNGTTYLVR